MQQIREIISPTLVMNRSDVDTDQIVPGRFLTTTTRDGLGDALFADWRYDKAGKPVDDFELNQPGAKECEVLVAGRNFGCGSSREHAPWALLDFGFRAIVSTEIADIFRNNSLNNGLVPVVVDELTHRWLIDNPGEEVRIDIETLSLTLPGGESVAFPMDGFSRYCIMNGLDQLGYIQQNMDAILKYEESRG